MRILLLSLYFPPLNNIASSRVAAFHRHLKSEGHEVDVITRYYDKEQQNTADLEIGLKASGNLKENYVYSGDIIRANFDENNELLSFSKMLPPGIKGLYRYFKGDVYYHGWFKYAEQAFKKELAGKKYDFIIASHGPPVVLKVASFLSSKYGIPWIADLRDSYIDERDRGFHRRVKKFVFNKLIGTSSALLYISPGMSAYVKGILNKRNQAIPSTVIYNGVNDDAVPEPSPGDEGVVKKMKDLLKSHRLVLLHTGSLNGNKKLDLFAKVTLGYNEQNPGNIALVCLGLQKEHVNKLKANYGGEKKGLYFLPKVKVNTVLYFQEMVDALLLPVWVGKYTGFSGKVFEYLYSENILLVDYPPQEDLKEFLEASPNVCFIKGKESKLLSIFNKMINGEIKAKVFKRKNELLRKHQVKRLEFFLKEEVKS